MTGTGLQVGTPQMKSVGPLAFGPEDVLFVADNVGAKVFAIDVRDGGAPNGSEPFDLEGVDARLAAFLGCDRTAVKINDIAVHPRSGNVYLAVSRGEGNAAMPVIVTIDHSNGSLADVPLEGIPCAEVSINNAPTEDQELWGFKMRAWTVTDLAYVDGTLFVAGASNEEFSSKFRRIPFPFTGDVQDSSLEIFHVSHGKYETAAPIRTFVPYGKDSILASYTCTPLVRFSLSDLVPGGQAKGQTVAELGSHNHPIDIVSYDRGGEQHVLISNTRHPLMKVCCSDIDRQTPLTQPEQPVGAPREELPHQGVTRMANLNGSYVLMLQNDEGGVHLHSVSTESL